ncbi:MAG: hypothetical protein N2376_12135, partial [Clostridia bacterium]|nr:hypothetical protein [Clostridia bacterium]
MCIRDRLDPARVENKDVDSIQVYMSKTLPKAQRNYLRDCLEVNLYLNSDAANLVLERKGPLASFRGEVWVMARMFEPFNTLNQDSAYIRVVLPKNLIIDDEKDKEAGR